MTSQADHNLAALAEGAFHRLGDYESLVFEGQAYRSGDLFDRACRVSAGLAKLGVSAGERVVVLMANCPEVGITYSAIWRAGAVVTPVVFLISPPELQHILSDSGAVAVVTTPELLATVTAAAAGAPQLRHVIVVGGTPDSLPGHVRGMDFAELESAPAAGLVAVSDDDLATLMYTGGTTGRAKGVMLSHRNLYYCSRSSHEASHAEGITRALTPLPLSHAYGMIVTLVGFHATERTLGVLQRWFDPAQFLALAQQHRIQRTALVPAMVQMLLAQPLEDFDLSALRYVNCGAAPLAAETREQWERRVPGSEILEGYGCTESGAVISVNPPGASRPGSVGRPIPGYQVAIRDDDDADVTAGADGEICVRADGVMGGYWNSPAETEATLRGGWLHTGDMGYADADGFIYLADRKKDMIVSGGENVYSREVEEALMAHPSVADAAVIGVPDERWGEAVKAVVVLKEGASTSAEILTRHCRTLIAGYKCPKSIEFVPDLPRLPSGKISKLALRERHRKQPLA